MIHRLIRNTKIKILRFLGLIRTHKGMKILHMKKQSLTSDIDINLNVWGIAEASNITKGTEIHLTATDEEFELQFFLPIIYPPIAAKHHRTLLII